MVQIDILRANLLTDAAEAACGQLMSSAAEYERITRSDSENLDFSRGDRGSFALSYVMRSVVIVELFAFERVGALSDHHKSLVGSSMLDHLYSAHRKAATATWDGAIDALRVWPGIKVRDFAEYHPLRGYIMARNSWAHGYGNLTDRQMVDLQNVRKRLTESGFHLRGRQVVVPLNSVRDVAFGCALFVNRLDRATKGYLKSP